MPDVAAIEQAVHDTAAVIGRGALLMGASFLAFAVSDLAPLSMLGTALAAAVVLDAALVRLVIAPALLVLLGQWNWWPGAPTGVSQDRAVR
jgi:RND superfamily putative drug exporter